MSTTYKPVEQAFQDDLKALADQKAHVRIQYYSDIREFFTVHAVLKDVIRKGEEDFLQLSSGEEVRLDRIVRVGSTSAPGYDKAYFKCDC